MTHTHLAAKTSLLHALVITSERVYIIARSLEARAMSRQFVEPVLYDDHEAPYGGLVGRVYFNGKG